MNVIDLLIAGIVAFATTRGLRRGLGREVIGLGATALLLFAGLPLARPLGEWVFQSVWPEGAPYATLVGFALLTLGVSLLVGSVTILWRRIMSTLSLGWLDVLAGGLFGLAKATALSLVLVLFLSWLPWLPLQNALARSAAADALLRAVPGVYSQVEKVLPRRWRLPKPWPDRERRTPGPGSHPDSWTQVLGGRPA